MGDITETVGPTYIPSQDDPKIEEVKPDTLEEKKAAPIIIEKVVERIIEKVVPVDRVVERLVTPAAVAPTAGSMPNITFAVEADEDADVIIEKT
jgi:hypothetical protein